MPPINVTERDERYIAARKQLMADLAATAIPDPIYNHRIQYFINHTAEMSGHVGKLFMTIGQWLHATKNEGWAHPLYVGSIDAALTLLPVSANHAYLVGSAPFQTIYAPNRRFQAVVAKRSHSGKITNFKAFGPTSAHALTIAILKCRGWHLNSTADRNAG